ncbi:hypothetical protein PG984_016114 [Apiospora sp. TS-2023a]
MITFCGQTWPQLIVPQRLTRYFTPYPADLMMTPWASYLNLEGFLRRDWRPGKAKGATLTTRCWLFCSLSSHDACKRYRPTPTPPHEQTTPVPISPSTVRTLLELGCDPRDQNLGLAFLDRFQKAHWGDSKTIVGVTQVGGKADT